LKLADLSRGGESLPREGALHEVDQNVADRLQIAPATLLDAQVRTKTRVTGSTCQILVFFKSAVHPVSVSVLFAQTKIYHVDYFRFAVLTDDEILRFYVSVDHVYLMQVLYSTYLLLYKFTSWSAIKQTVYRLNFLLHFSNNSSKFGPIKSKTITLYSFS
jgi:hypothetical protein